jgi:hypothetical protein
VSPIRRAAPVVGAAILAVLALPGCSSSSSPGSASSSSTSSAAASDTSTGAPSVTGSIPTPSIDSQRLTAIATCLKNAGLATPTSTDPAQAVPELVRLVKDPRMLTALKACGIPVPGPVSPSS